ncbi:MAG: DUF4437 domain-containing protein [Planctomycetota bacterium]
MFQLFSAANAQDEAANIPANEEAQGKVVLASELAWEQLNPARGDQSPQAANVWGNRTESRKTGFLVKFVDGFESPPHIHNVSYRGVVISGLVHNDDPESAEMWMPPGSYWTQPAGEVHITSATGSSIVAYIEIENGPYRVMSVDESFDNGERPVNIDAANLVWLNEENTNWIAGNDSSVSAGAELAFLWGSPQDDQLNGTFVKLPAGFSGSITTESPEFRAVVISGAPQFRTRESDAAVALEPGSYVSSTGSAQHQLSCVDGGCTIYVRTIGRFTVNPN